MDNMKISLDLDLYSLKRIKKLAREKKITAEEEAENLLEKGIKISELSEEEKTLLKEK